MFSFDWCVIIFKVSHGSALQCQQNPARGGHLSNAKIRPRGLDESIPTQMRLHATA